MLSDERVYSLYGATVTQQLTAAGLGVDTLLLPGGESSKTLMSAASCWERMHAFGLDREAVLIALGGGVVTDLAGFVASCYMRGIDFICVPTTLLGMVDAAIGGKTGVNLPSGKNLVGSFYQPKLVLVALETLGSLPPREMSAGLAEVIKYGFIGHPGVLELLETKMPALRALDPDTLEEIVRQCVAVKMEYTSADPFESGVRSHLNFGHTFGHALEAATGYSLYLHGEAVAIGMSCAAYLSVELGLVPEEVIAHVDRLCLAAGLPVALPAVVSDDQILEGMWGDKKVQLREIHCIVLHSKGQRVEAEKRAVSEGQIRKALHNKRLAVR